MHPSSQFHAILPRLPGINSHVLLVGPPDFPLGYGIPVSFTKIGDAMDAIPLFDPDLRENDPNAHNPVEQWTILVTPGYYPEVLKFKPFVNVVGLVKEAVIIAGQTRDAEPLGAQVYLCSRSLLSNVTLAIRGDAKLGDFVVRGYDVNTYPGGVHHNGDVHFLGLSNVDFFPFPPFPGSHHPAGGGLIKFDGGDWRTVIFRDVGGNYDAPEGYGIELIGRFQNADCHFINCFFDALFLAREGGYIYAADCFEVHLRNSLVRVDYLDKNVKPPIAAVKTYKSEGAGNKLSNVIIEGSSLYGPSPNVLDVGDNTTCFFRHSSSDSKSGNGQFIPSGPGGIGNG